MNKETGGPAFPFEYHNQTRSHQEGFFGTGQLAPGASQQFAGVTLRDYFASRALQNFRDQIGSQSDQEWFEQMAQGAYRMADAMLKARQ